jgi:hypothetical protein
MLRKHVYSAFTLVFTAIVYQSARFAEPRNALHAPLPCLKHSTAASVCSKGNKFRRGDSEGFKASFAGPLGSAGSPVL